MSWLAFVGDWVSGRTLRERWLLGIMLAIALPLLGFLLVYQPLMNRLDQAQDRHVAAVQQHGRVLAQVEQLRSAASVPATTASAPLAIRVTDSATRAGIRLAANEPRGANRVSVVLAPAAPTAGLRWLREMETTGISIQELSIAPQGPGMVTISATLAQGGAS